MKLAYPIVLTPAETGYSVYVPDLDINTEGDSLADAIAMASDAIGLWGITKQDMGGEIPAPSETLPPCQSGETATYALVDFDAYRRANDMRTVRKNVTLQSWLNDMAEKAGVNFPQVHQEAPNRRRGATDRRAASFCRPGTPGGGFFTCPIRTPAPSA